MKKIILLLALITALLIISGCGPDKEALAKCLTEKGFKMYGTYWCSHCQAQKDMFGDAFKQINYIECAIQGSDLPAEECTLAGIRGYPTWVLPDGSKQEGAITLSQFQTISGCPG
ncbi:MAG: hypothetical protein V1729_00955 [Candidatus Woesearchaeota archaeon]